MTKARRREGFALLMAIALLAIMTMAMATLAVVLTRQAKRTMALRQDAQLRQLLLAGGAAVLEKANKWDASPVEAQWPVELPKPLAADGAKLTVQIKQAENQQALATVDATLGPRRLRQTLKLARGEKGWEIRESRLE